MQTEEITTMTQPAFFHSALGFMYLTGRNIYRWVHSRATVAWRQDGDSVEYAVAWAAPVDQFNKRLGRTIAEGRLESGRCYRVKVAEGQTPHRAIRADMLQYKPSRWLSPTFM